MCVYVVFVSMCVCCVWRVGEPLPRAAARSNCRRQCPDQAIRIHFYFGSTPAAACLCWALGLSQSRPWSSLSRTFVCVCVCLCQCMLCAVGILCVVSCVSLTRAPLQHKYDITIAADDVSAAQRMAASVSGATATKADASRPNPALESLIRSHDVVLSLLPAVMHPHVAQTCVAHGKHLVTASYICTRAICPLSVSLRFDSILCVRLCFFVCLCVCVCLCVRAAPAMKELDAAARAANVALLNELVSIPVSITSKRWRAWTKHARGGTGVSRVWHSISQRVLTIVDSKTRALLLVLTDAMFLFCCLCMCVCVCRLRNSFRGAVVCRRPRMPTIRWVINLVGPRGVF